MDFEKIGKNRFFLYIKKNYSEGKDYPRTELEREKIAFFRENFCPLVFEKVWFSEYRNHYCDRGRLP